MNFIYGYTDSRIKGTRLNDVPVYLDTKLYNSKELKY